MLNEGTEVSHGNESWQTPTAPPLCFECHTRHFDSSYPTLESLKLNIIIQSFHYHLTLTLEHMCAHMHRHTHTHTQTQRHTEVEYVS